MEWQMFIAVLFGGTMTLIVVAIVAWWSPKLRQMREIPVA